MTKTAETVALEKALDEVLASLLRATGGSRSTLRIDEAARGRNVDVPCAEALKDGVRSLRGDGSINQRAAETVTWMVAHRRNLVQPDLTRNPSPAPPAALMSAYAAKAQMLGPLFAKDTYLAGWISLHYVDAPHALTADDERAMDQARGEACRLTGIGT